jgi:hypothetical protein
MSIKETAKNIIEELPDEATWDDLVKSLIKNKKITLGMTDLEIVQDSLSDDEISMIVARMHSLQEHPSEVIKSTAIYNVDNAITLGMLSGVVAVFFSFIFPPVSWLGAIIAIVAGGVALKHKQTKGWIPIVMAIVSIVPVLFVLET